MLIVHMTNSLRDDGTGLTNSTVDLAIAQVGGGDEVWIICREKDLVLEKLLHRQGVRVIGRRASRLGDLRALLRRSDVIHVHTVKGMLCALGCVPGGYWRRSVSTFHNPHQRTTLLLLVARRVVALNTRDCMRLARLNPLSRVTVVRNGTLGSQRLAPAESVRAEALPARSIVFVGALHRRKGLDILFEAVALMRRNVPDVSLYVVGNRDDPAFEQLAFKLGIAECTTFVGFLRDPRGYMRGAGVFVLPSRDEGFGNVLTEARSVGAPIVASRVGGIPEALNNGRAGLLVEPEDPEGLAVALTSVLTENMTRTELVRRSHMGLEKVSVMRFRDDYEHVYRSLPHVAKMAASMTSTVSTRWSNKN